MTIYDKTELKLTKIKHSLVNSENFESYVHLDHVVRHLHFRSIIGERQAKWIGHVLRHDSLLSGGRIGKRPNRRPRQKTLDWMTDKVNRKTYGHLKGRVLYSINGRES